ncbi:hypothetical protein O9H85_08115 [Paenibacillus filicis]|uniref:Uncharacterized protein n=1 Tax=Paenibacillus gyeongsangnamensis TaxID=3388067 RepID=A0ABT4Q695_9BACL|nr:hypothetical protein [Paenibacillus filicis]MCZ8512397.1 hypothetical protein [Paenibacillus filicis]
MINSNYSLVGEVTITVKNEDGSVASLKKYNTITNYMKSSLAKWLSGTPNSGVGAVLPPTQIGAGNGSPPFGINGTLPTDTALWSAISGTQRNCDSIQVSQGYYAQYNLAYQTTDPAGFYNELGLFDSNNNLWAHVSINQYKSSSQTLTVQWMVYMVADTSNSSAVITNYMRSTFAKWMTGTSNVSGQSGAIVPPNKFQLGTGTGNVQVTDTALWNATVGTSKTCDFITIIQSYNVQFAVTYQIADPNGNYTEVGWIDASGNLWLHGSINANKTNGLLLSVIGQVGILGN